MKGIESGMLDATLVPVHFAGDFRKHYRVSAVYYVIDCTTPVPMPLKGGRGKARRQRSQTESFAKAIEG